MFVDGSHLGVHDLPVCRFGLAVIRTVLPLIAEERGFVDELDDLVDTMEHIKSMRGTPRRIQVDNGSEFISKALDLWAYENEVTLDFSRPGKPTDNPFIESFNGSFRDECLNLNWFANL